MAAPTVAALAAGLLARRPALGRLRLRFGDAAVELASDSRPLLAELAAYFATYVVDPAADPAAPDLEVVALESPPLELGPGAPAPVVRPPEPGKTSVKEASVDLEDGRVIHKLRTGMSFLVGGGVHMAVGPCERYPNQIVNFIDNRLIERQLRRGWALCHAAAVAVGERALVLAGLSGRGKSTLALHLMEAGADYISNDRLLIRREGDRLAVLGVPKLPRINPGTALSIPRLAGLVPDERRRALAALPPAELWQIEEKYDVDVRAAYGPDRQRLDGAAVGLMVLTWTHGGGPVAVRPARLAERRDLLAAVMKGPGLFYEAEGSEDPNDLDDAAYLAHFGDLPVYEAAGGADFAAAVAFGLGVLRGEAGR